MKYIPILSGLVVILLAPAALADDLAAHFAGLKACP